MAELRLTPAAMHDLENMSLRKKVCKFEAFCGRI